MFKGSNMIVCVLLVSNSLGCCLAAPARRDNTRESLIPTIHTQSCWIPIITWCHHFFHCNQYSAHWKQFKLWIESNHSPLPCHHVILVASIAVASTPGGENARVSFCGRLSVWNRTAPDRRHLLPVATMKLIMRCVAHCPFKRKWQVLHNYDISVLQRVGMFSDGIACLMKVWPLFKLEFSRVPMTWRSVRARISMWHRRCKQTDPHWFQGRQMRFWRMLSFRENSSWYVRSDCLVQQIFNQSSSAAYFQQFTGSCYSLWITGNSLWHRDYPGHDVDWCQLYFQGKYISYVLINIFSKLKISYFNFYNIFICATCKHFTL